MPVCASRSKISQRRAGCGALGQGQADLPAGPHRLENGQGLIVPVTCRFRLAPEHEEHAAGAAGNSLVQTVAQPFGALLSPVDEAFQAAPVAGAGGSIGVHDVVVEIGHRRTPADRIVGSL